MKFLFQIMLFFFIVFNFWIPITYNSAWMAIAIATGYYLIVRRTIPFTYFFSRYYGLIVLGLIAISLICLAYTSLHREYDFFILKVFGLQFFLLSALVYILPIIFPEDESFVFEDILKLVCYTFTVQGVIQFLGLLIPSFGDFMISIKSDAQQEAFLGAGNIYFRGYALTGSVFFELPSGFGVAFICFFRILSIKNQTFISSNMKYIVFFFLFVGATLSGRTAFVGLLLGVVYFIFSASFSNLLKTFRYIPVFAVGLFVLYTFVFSSELRTKLQEDVFPFAFEFMYNYEEKGELTTNSSDVITEYHYFPLSDKTFLHGDGRYTGINGQGFYMKTDAGYMRNILFGGIPFLICLILYQSLFFITPFKYAGKAGLKNDYIFFLILFLHLFILDYKGNSIAWMNIMEVLLFTLGIAYIKSFVEEDSEHSQEQSGSSLFGTLK